MEFNSQDIFIIIAVACVYPIICDKIVKQLTVTTPREIVAQKQLLYTIVLSLAIITASQFVRNKVYIISLLAGGITSLLWCAYKSWKGASDKMRILLVGSITGALLLLLTNSDIYSSFKTCSIVDVDDDDDDDFEEAGDRNVHDMMLFKYLQNKPSPGAVMSIPSISDAASNNMATFSSFIKRLRN